MKKKLISIIVMSIALVSASNVMTVQAENTQVEDTTPPVIKGAKNRTIYKGYKTNLLSGVSAKDDVDGKVKVRVTKYKDKVGKQRITYTAKDSAGNVAKKTVVLTVKKDTKKPRFSGVNDKIFYKGDKIDLLEGVSAVDNADSSVKITVSKINKKLYDKKQKVTYRAIDDAGNVTKKTIYITIKSKYDGVIQEESDNPEDWQKEWEKLQAELKAEGLMDENGNLIPLDYNISN